MKGRVSRSISDKDARAGLKIGVLVPYTNVNLEPDMQMLRPAGCTMHFARMGGYDSDEIPGYAQMENLGAADLGETVRLINGARPAAVLLYGCTSATLVHGNEFNVQLAQTIEAQTGAVSITAAGALVYALAELGANKVGFSSPYVGQINSLAVEFLSQHGIVTVSQTNPGRALGNHDQGELSPQQVTEMALELDHSQCDAIVLSCTDMRSVEAVERIESVTGKPVVTSNQAMIFALCRKLKLSRPTGDYGVLFERV